MTDRVHSLTVILAEDIRTDDVEPLQNAIRHLRGVIAVEGNVSNVESKMAEERALYLLRDQLRDVLWPKRS